MLGKRNRLDILLMIVISLISIVGFGQNVSQTKSVVYEVFTVSGLNTEYADFSPVLFGQEVVFSSDRVYDFTNLGEDNWSKNKHINIFTAVKEVHNKDSVVFGQIKLFDMKFVADEHSGPISFTYDKNTAVYTKVSSKGQKVFGKDVARPQLYIVKREDGKWLKPEKLPFVNENKTYGHAFISNEGNIIYYVSDDFGGKGGKDIFEVKWEGASWGSPKALNILNSENDELFPVCVDDKLYFSSNGHGGSGGLDLFVSIFKDGAWSAPRNLGPTINSVADDFGMLFNPDRTTGFFSSNRENGVGDDDIYLFNRIEQITRNTDNNSIAGKFTHMNLDGSNSNNLEVMLVDDEGNLVQKTRTDENGNFNFKNLDPNANYTIKLIDGSDYELELFGKGIDSYLVANKKGEFIYKKLSSEQSGTLSLMDEDDFDPLTGKGDLKGRFVFTELDGKSPEGLEVYLLDADGNIVQRTKTDKDGNFVFKNLSNTENYTLSSQSSDDEVEIFIFDKNNTLKTVLASDKKGDFIYKKLDIEKSKLELIEEDEIGLSIGNRTIFLSGVFEYSDVGGKLSNIDYEIYDEDYKLLKKSTTNTDGYFEDETIKNQDIIIFKIDGDKFKDGVNLIIYDKNKGLILKLDKDNDGYFVYRKLENDRAILTYQNEDKIDPLTMKGLVGKFDYKYLETDGNVGLEYEIYDEEDLLLRKGRTDKNGYFFHEDLDKNGKYKFRVLGNNKQSLLKVWTDDEGMLILVRDGDYFVFKKLQIDTTPLDSISDGDNTLLSRRNEKISEVLYYDNAKYSLSGVNKDKLDKIITQLKTDNYTKIIINSYTSNVGSSSFNVRLSRRRKSAVIDYLKAHGIRSYRIEGYYFGEKDPAVDCDSKECSESDHALNRRTEFRLVK